MVLHRFKDETKGNHGGGGDGYLIVIFTGTTKAQFLRFPFSHIFQFEVQENFQARRNGFSSRWKSCSLIWSLK